MAMSLKSWLFIVKSYQMAVFYLPLKRGVGVFVLFCMTPPDPIRPLADRPTLLKEGYFSYRF